jgi:hypothetical protein
MYTLIEIDSSGVEYQTEHPTLSSAVAQVFEFLLCEEGEIFSIGDEEMIPLEGREEEVRKHLETGGVIEIHAGYGKVSKMMIV